METSTIRKILDSKYSEYKNKYTDVMLNLLLKDYSDSNFSCIEGMVKENEYCFPKRSRTVLQF